MSLSKKIAINTILHTGGRFLGSAMGIVIIAMITRYLGRQGFGHLTTITAYLFFFSILADLGLYLVTINELGRPQINQSKFFSNVFTLRFCSGLILMFLACVIIWFFPYPRVVKIGTAINALVVFFQLVDQTLVAVFQVKLKTIYHALAEIVGKSVILVLIIWAIKNNQDLYFIIWVFVIGLLVHFSISFFSARKLLKFKFSFDISAWKKILAKSWPIATYMVFSMIYFKADTIILSLYHPAEIVGLYGAPYKILEALIVMPAIFMGLVSPHLSRSFSEKNILDFKNIFQKAFDVLSLIIFLILAVTLPLANKIINLIAGTEFLASTPILQILIFATAIIFLAHLTTFSVVAIEKQKQMMKYYIFAAISALALYFIFIPKYSYYAAAIITVTVELFILLASSLMIKKNTHIKISWSIFNKAFLSGILTIFILLYSGLTNLNIFISIIITIVIYSLCLFATRAINKDLIKNLR